MDILLPEDDGSAVHGAAHLDVDNDGDIDLVLARESGVWLYINDVHTNGTHGKLVAKKLEFGLDATTTPLSIALGDINADGIVDMYVSGYIRNDLVSGTTNFSDHYGGYSYLLLGNGDNSWRDVSKQAGVWRQHNTFTAVFVDLDNDHDSDLVIAQDTGLVEMYENTNHFPLKRIANPSVNSYPMGLAVGDYDNNALADIYVSNVGHTLPGIMLRGNLAKGAPLHTEYYLLRNTGRLQFEDSAKQAGVGRLGFGWGTVFADMNMDGNIDILVSQNYVKMPAILRAVNYCGKLLQNDGHGHFSLVGKTAKADDRGFGISPLVGDFNADGYPDLIWVNINGPAKAKLNQGKGVKGEVVRLPDTVKSLNAIIVQDEDVSGQITRQIIAGQGLGSDASRSVFFPPAKTPRHVYFQNGERAVLH